MTNRQKTALELSEALREGATTSEALVLEALKTIEKYDGTLNALCDLNHHALLEARALDLERREHGPRGPLHGIPVIIKDNILTKGPMRTTVNARVFKDFYAPYDATLVKKIKAAGMVILAKASLSEFAYYMSTTTMPSGYGSLFGQVVHPYDPSIDPLGSSTGSAVGVARGYVPLSVGTETNGSLMSPAMKNGIVSIKPTLGRVSRHGIVPVSSHQDTAGPMSTTLKDSAMLLDVMKGRDEADPFTALIPKDETDYLAACDRPISGMRVGLLNFKGHEASGEEADILKEAKSVLEKQGVVVEDITHTYDLPDNTRTLTPEFHRDMNHFLSTVRAATDIHTLHDIVTFNRADPRRNLKHGQGRFLNALGQDQRLKDPDYLKAKRENARAIDKFMALFETYNLDAVVTTKITGYPPVGGLPSIIIPAKAL
ncbi:MAG: amidase family protein, partial [Bacillota bacterium]